MKKKMMFIINLKGPVNWLNFLLYKMKFQKWTLDNYEIDFETIKCFHVHWTLSNVYSRLW